MVPGFSQVKETGSGPFHEKFRQAKNFLFKDQTGKALPILQDLQEMRPDHPNVKYLLGICYTQERPASDTSIHLLEASKDALVKDYDPYSTKERGVPVYVHYFLSTTYAKKGQCEKAEKNRKKFLRIYEKENNFYTKNAKELVDSCFKWLWGDKKGRADSLGPLSDRQYKATQVEYSEGKPIYAVQVGAFARFVPSAAYTDLKYNVDYHLDNDDRIRAVVGNFSRRRSAKNVLEAIREKGYEDAFIVRLDEKKKNSKALLSVDDVKLRNKVRGKIRFRIQLGAFDDHISKDLAHHYTRIDDIEKDHRDGMTYLLTGEFKSYEKAREREKELKEKGIDEAFVVAYDYDERIPVQRALNYLKKKGKADDQ